MSDILLTETEAPVKPSLAAARARVAFGSRWLDVNCPGWDAHVNVATLDIANPFLCVLGQIAAHYGFRPYHPQIESGYGWFLNSGRLPTNMVVPYGFAGSPEVSNASLTEAWREEITARRPRRSPIGGRA